MLTKILTGLLKLSSQRTENKSMRALTTNRRAPHRGNEGGFTLPEVLVTILIMGMVAAIAVPSWFGIVERRGVDSATNQITADLRLAHTNATNKLSTWGIVLAPGREAESDGPDYYLIRFDAAGSVVPTDTKSRTLPGNVTVTNVTNPALNDSLALLGLGTSRTIKFSPNGSAAGPGTGVAGFDTIRVTNDGSPQGEITFVGTTSRVRAQVVN